MIRWPDGDCKCRSAAHRSRLLPLAATKKRDRKKSNKKVDLDSDNDSDVDPLKRTAKNALDSNEIADVSEDDMRVAMKFKSKKDKKKKGGFSALAIDDSDDGKPRRRAS